MNPIPRVPPSYSVPVKQTNYPAGIYRRSRKSLSCNSPTELFIACEGVLKTDVKVLMKHIFSLNNRLQVLFVTLIYSHNWWCIPQGLMGLENQEIESWADLWFLSTEGCFPRP